MNREIKFRFWRFGEDKMYNEPTVDGKYKINELFTDNRTDKIAWMQFTGLKDKNGKEIYFGDILATHNDGKDGCDTWVIDQEGYTVVEELKNELGVAYSKWWVELEDSDSIYSNEYIEVVGNIYENPELLKNN
jgi:uncharacterized phage protein (TIGR01671 family)